MNNISIMITFYLLFSLFGCNKVQSDSKQNLVSVSGEINDSFVLIPVQEDAAVVRTNFSIENYPSTQKTFYVRLAKDTVDYWVHIDVKAYQGKKYRFEFEGNRVDFEFGLNQIKTGLKPEINYYETYRPGFHFSAERGWINDPNGMVYLDGEYHLFYQYNPYGTKWGNMSWGHAVSVDLVTWSNLDTSLYPDSLGDIFSGSAVIDVNNTAGFGKNAMIAVYTSAGKVQSQSIAYSTDKGRTFKKFKGNPVLANSGNPDFRDPKVFWNVDTKKWIMTLATRQTISFYASANLKNWEKLSEFGEGVGSHAGVWECPDLIPMLYKGERKWVLLVSINPGGPNGGSATQYFIGDFDGQKFEADPLPYPLWLDYGRDNYASVTWSNIPEKDGRKILVGWMNNWQYAENVPTEFFKGSMTFPRELKLLDNGTHLILANYPVSELSQISKKSIHFDHLLVNDTSAIEQLLPVNEGSFSIQFEISSNDATNFGFKLKNSANEFIKFNFNSKKGYVYLDRKNSGKIDFHPDFVLGMGAPFKIRKENKIKMIVDKASVELFINEGEVALTASVFPKAYFNGIEFFTDKTIHVSGITVNKIK